MLVILEDIVVVRVSDLFLQNFIVEYEHSSSLFLFSFSLRDRSRKGRDEGSAKSKESVRKKPAYQWRIYQRFLLCDPLPNRWD